jgi:hypothetical protein
VLPPFVWAVSCAARFSGFREQALVQQSELDEIIACLPRDRTPSTIVHPLEGPLPSCRARANLQEGMEDSRPLGLGARSLSMKKYSGLAVLLLVFAGGVGCSSGDEDDGSSGDGDSGCDPYDCDCGVGLKSSGSATEPPTCVGIALCNETDECPLPKSGSAEVACQDQGDVVTNGYSGYCIIECDGSVTCPTGMDCFNGRCAFADEERRRQLRPRPPLEELNVVDNEVEIHPCFVIIVHRDV